MVDVSLFLDGQTQGFDVKEVTMRYTRLRRPRIGDANSQAHDASVGREVSVSRSATGTVLSALARDVAFLTQVLGPLHLRSSRDTDRGKCVASAQKLPAKASPWGQHPSRFIELMRTVVMMIRITIPTIIVLLLSRYMQTSNSRYNDNNNSSSNNNNNSNNVIIVK